MLVAGSSTKYFEYFFLTEGFSLYFILNIKRTQEGCIYHSNDKLYKTHAAKIIKSPKSTCLVERKLS